MTDSTPGARPEDTTPTAAASAVAGPFPAPDGRVALRTIILMRWIAIAGQLTSLAVIAGVLEYDLPLGPTLATIGASVLVNLAVHAQRGSQPRVSDRDASLYLGYDILQLTLLLYFTGGLPNPFVLLLLAPLTVGAAVLSAGRVVLLTLVNQICLTVIALQHFPLPWPGPSPDLPPLYVFGLWLALSMTAVLIAIYVFRVAHESRRMADALSATQMALAREQRLSALGGLAAAAAHELGTPLGTIALVTKELVKELEADDPIADDIKLLLSQSDRCREILSELTRRPEADGGAPYERLSLAALVEEAARPHRTASIAFTVATSGLPGGLEPVVKRRPEVLHGLGNLLQNALQFAKSQVTVTALWDAETITLILQDDGPGLPAHVLSRLGEPYFSGRGDKAGHMGLGVFIAQNLLRRSGAVLDYGNNPDGGARVVVRWARRDLDVGPGF